MKKALSLVLAATAITTMTAFANDDVMLISDEPATEVVETMEAPAYLTAYGDITEVGEDYIVVNTTDGQEIQFNTSDSTQIIDANTVLPLDLTARETDKVAITYSNAATMSIPPQAYAYAIIGNIKSDMGNPIFTIVEEVVQGKDGITIITENDSKHINVQATAEISPYLTRNIVTLSDIKAGSNVLLWYDAVTMSIPAYATSEKVVVMPGNVMEMPAESTDEPSTDALTVNGVEITLAEGEVVYDNNGIEMLPLRTVAETLGFKVEWVNETQSIIVSKDAFSATVRIGTTEGGINKMRLVLETAPVLYGGTKTYVPTSFFAELPASN